MPLRARNVTLFILFSTVAFFTTLLVLAGDGRVNPAAHLGGLAVYMLDADGNLTTSAATALTIRVLDATGAPVLEVAVPNQTPAENTLLGSTDWRTGTITIWQLSGGEFQINGTDEHGKPFEFRWSQVVSGSGASRGNALAGFSDVPSVEIQTPTPTAIP